MELRGNAERLFISLLVFIELAWVLSRKNFRRTAIYRALWQLLETDHIVVGQHDLIREALTLYKTGKADFADYIIMCDSAHSGARTLASFDLALVKERPDYCKHPIALVT